MEMEAARRTLGGFLFENWLIWNERLSPEGDSDVRRERR